VRGKTWVSPAEALRRREIQGAWASCPQSTRSQSRHSTVAEAGTAFDGCYRVIAHHPRNFFKIPLLSALLRLRALLSSVVKNSATFRSPTSALRFLFSLRAPASPREIPFLFPIRGHLPSFAGPKNPENPYAKTPTRRIIVLEIFSKFRYVPPSALFPLSTFNPRSGILRGNPPGSGRSFF
jgi:hypothetical protein